MSTVLARQLATATLAVGCAMREAPVETATAARQTVEYRDPDVGYYVLVDRFWDGDQWNNESYDVGDPQAFHGGDLRGILDRLDHVKDLGVRTLWLSPIFEMRDTRLAEEGAYRGAWTVDLARLEPRFGDLGMAVALAKGLRQRRMDLALDLVFDHVAPDSPLVGEHPDWFEEGGEGEAGLLRYKLHLAEAYTYVVTSTLYWLNTLGVHEVRVHHAGQMPGETLNYLADDLRSRAPGGLRVVGDVGATRSQDQARALERTGLDAVTDHALRLAITDVYCRGASVGRLAGVLSDDRLFADPYQQLVTQLDGPDLPRFAAVCAGAGRGPVEHQQALAFLLSSRGRPLLTYGTEFGLAGEHPPDSLPDMPWGDPTPYAATVREFSDARRTCPSVAEGVPWIFHLAGDDVLGVARVLPDEATVVMVNRGREQAMVRLPATLSEGAAMTTFHEVDAAEGPFRRHQIVANPSEGPRHVRPFFLVANSTVVAHVEPDGPGGFGALTEQLRAWSKARVPVVFRVEPTRDTAVAAAELDVGKRDLLVLSGEAEALGEWNPHRVLLLEPEPGGGWLSPPVELGAWSAVEWRLGVRRPGGQIEWEQASSRWSLIGAPREDGAAVEVTTLVR